METPALPRHPLQLPPASTDAPGGDPVLFPHCSDLQLCLGVSMDALDPLAEIISTPSSPSFKVLIWTHIQC